MGLIQFLALFFFAPALHAAEVSWGTEVDYESYYYFSPLSKPTRNNDQIVHFEPSLDIKYNKRSRMVFKPHLRANLSTDESPERAFINPKEAYWEIKTALVRARLGANTQSWGVMDGYSPLDVTNGRVLFNPLSTDKRGSAGLDLFYENDWFQLEALYIPYQSRTLFPSTDSRWLPRSFLLSGNAGDTAVILPVTLNYHYPGTDNQTEAMQNNFGFRLSSRQGNWDFGAVFFDGAGINPQVRVSVNGDATSLDTIVIAIRPDVNLVPVYYRQQTAGGQIVWAPGEWIVRLETAYGRSRLSNSLVAPWMWQNALGVEKPIPIGSTTLTLIAQTYYAENHDTLDNMVSSTNRLFDRAVVIGARWAISDDSTILFSSLYNYRYRDQYFHLAYDTRFWEKYKFTLAGDVLGGPQDSILGSYTKNDRLTALMGYTW